MLLISIVTITYQAERTLQRTLDSVARQTYPHIEHLIVDGQSKDKTVDMARRYQESCSHEVTVVSEPDKGLYDAMNKGLRMAKGDYIVFLNAGDSLYADDTIQTVVDVAQSACSGDAAQAALPAVVYGDTAITDGDGHFLRMRRHRPPEQLTWRSFMKGMLVCHQAFYVRLDLARDMPYNLKYRHSADVDWCIRVMREAAHRKLKLANTHRVLANFEEGGDTKQNHRASLIERYHVMSSHYGSVTTFLLHCWFVLRSLLGKGGTE